MNPYPNWLQTKLEKRFQNAIALLYPHIGEKELAAWGRLQNFSKAASIALPLLAEPWWRKMCKRRLKIFYACADIHLYSRVLDDAIDEGKPCQKKALLAIQEKYWAAVTALAKTRPELAGVAPGLIYESAKAAANQTPSPASWAEKCHSLLLIPLFLAARKASFDKYRRDLSTAIGILQAEEELRQGDIIDFCALCAFIEKGAECAVNLMAGGWPLFAERALYGCKRLLSGLESYGRVF